MSSVSLEFGTLAPPQLNTGAALTRLGAVAPLLPPTGLETVHYQAQSMLQMSVQMLALLTMLMVGQPNPAWSQPSGLEAIGRSGRSGPGERIEGGKALYAHGKGMFHKGKGGPDTYAFENSPAGIKYAAEHGFASIDIDMQITKDGVPVATHWSKPMAKDGFYDPLGQLKPNTKVSQMTLAEVMRLRNKDGQSRIYPLSTIVGELKKNGIAGDFEAKDDPRFATDQMMGYIADLVRGAGIKANMKSINRGPRSMDILKAAQRSGFWTRFATGGGKRGRPIGYGTN